MKRRASLTPRCVRRRQSSLTTPRDGCRSLSPVAGEEPAVLNILDLAAVPYMDSCGLGMTLAAPSQPERRQPIRRQRNVVRVPNSCYDRQIFPPMIRNPQHSCYLEQAGTTDLRCRQESGEGGTEDECEETGIVWGSWSCCGRRSDLLTRHLSTGFGTRRTRRDRRAQSVSR